MKEIVPFKTAQDWSSTITRILLHTAVFFSSMLLAGVLEYLEWSQALSCEMGSCCMSLRQIRLIVVGATAQRAP